MPQVVECLPSKWRPEVKLQYYEKNNQYVFTPPNHKMLNKSLKIYVTAVYCEQQRRKDIKKNLNREILHIHGLEESILLSCKLSPR
jgi:hypothetical protein